MRPRPIPLGLEGVEIDGPPDVCRVAVVWVEPLDESGGFGIGERPPLDGRPTVAGDLGLEGREDLRTGRGPGR